MQAMGSAPLRLVAGAGRPVAHLQLGGPGGDVAALVRAVRRAELLDERRDPGSLALVDERLRPAELHAPGARSGLTANDDPVQVAPDTTVQRREHLLAPAVER